MPSNMLSLVFVLMIFPWFIYLVLLFVAVDFPDGLLRGPDGVGNKTNIVDRTFMCLSVVSWSM